MTIVHVFVSFDLDHDNDCKSRLIDEVTAGGSHFTVDDWSIREVADDWRDKAEKRLSNVDLLLVICGEYTDAAANVNNEIARRPARSARPTCCSRAGLATRRSPPPRSDRDRVLERNLGATALPPVPHGTIR